MALATVCAGARATAINPSEKTSAMTSARERMKNGMPTGGASKIAVSTMMTIARRSEHEVGNQLRGEQS
jgi:hypothetical protein